MALIASILAGVIALAQLNTMVLQMFFWTTPFVRRIFGRTPEDAASSAVLAANQGLYNGFLAAGLIWSLVAAPHFVLPLRTFFLACIVIAGIYGGITGSRKILLAQALPAALALGAAWL